MKPLRQLAKTLALLVFFWLSLSGLTNERPPVRIVSLAPNVTEVLYELGLGDRIVAVSTFCNYPPEVKKKPKIGGMSNPSLEAIIALKPDLVVLTDDGNPRMIAEQLAKLKIPTYAFRAKRISDLPNEIRRLGVALGVRKQGEQCAHRIETVLTRYARKPALGSGLAPKKILFIVQPEPLMVAGPGTAIDDTLQLLSLRNIAHDAPAGYPRFSLEEVIRRSPDMIFMVNTNSGMADTTDQLLKKLKSLDAVRKGRVHYIGDPLLRMGPRITEGIAEVARHLEAEKP